MAAPNWENDIARVLAERTRTTSSEWHCVFKARHGMRVAFEAVRDLMGPGAVGTQLLTCCTAVDPILVAGLTPCYLDISGASGAIDSKAFAACDDVRAVVLQHTYGIIDADESREFVRLAHERGIPVIEDCAHCVGRMATDEAGAPLADISIHSFGIEKVLDTLYGGAVWVNPASPFTELTDRIADDLAALPAVPRHLGFLAHINRFQLRVFGHIPASAVRALRRTLPKIGLFDPAVAEVERRGGLPYEPFRPTRDICEKVSRELAHLDANERSRMSVVSTYRTRLRDLPHIEIPASAMAGEAQPLLKFPILVRDTEAADAVIHAVCDAGYFTSAWYRPELTPGVLDKDAYHVPHDRSALTCNDDFIARVATLPTNIDPAAADAVVDAVLSVVAP